MSTKKYGTASIELAIWAIWLGSLWFLAILVAPGLFKWLPRPEAALAAGRLFYMMSWFSLVASTLLLLMSAIRLGVASLNKALAGCLVVIVGLSLIELLWLTPIMHGLRQSMSVLSGPDLEATRTQFGHMHAISSVMYAVKMIAGLAWGVGMFSAKSPKLAQDTANA